MTVFTPTVESIFKVLFVPPKFAFLKCTNPASILTVPSVFNGVVDTTAASVNGPTKSAPPPVTLRPLLAVINPTESILVTSSYVNVPPTLTLPLKEAVAPVTDPTTIFGVPVNPCAVVAVVAVVAVSALPLISVSKDKVLPVF